jgi:hypothetical protein
MPFLSGLKAITPGQFVNLFSAPTLGRQSDAAGKVCEFLARTGRRMLGLVHGSRNRP